MNSVNSDTKTLPNTKNRYAVAVYLCIGLLGIIFALVSLLNSAESSASLALNLGTELIGASLVFFTLRFFLLDNDYDVKLQLERIEQNLLYQKHKSLTSPLDTNTVIQHIMDANTLKICGYEHVRLIERLGHSLQKIIQSGTEIQFLVVSEEGLGHELINRYDPLPEFPHNSLRAIGELQAMERKLSSQGLKPNVTIKTVEWIPSCSLIIAEKDRGLSWISVEIYPLCFDTSSGDRAAFQITSDDDWFDYFDNQFDKLWELGDVVSSGTY